jgi:hypothetical protein
MKGFVRVGIMFACVPMYLESWLLTQQKSVALRMFSEAI